MGMPHVHNIRAANEEIAAVVEVNEIGHEAIRLHRKGRVEADTSWRGELESTLTRSSLMFAHSIFEFAFKQFADHVVQLDEGKRQKGVSLLEAIAKQIQAKCGDMAAFQTDDWQALLLISRIRNVIVHATGYQDRDFLNDELGVLAKFGIRHALQIVPPMFCTFYFEAKAVRLVCNLYSRLLDQVEIEFSEIQHANP